jgi:hypothetical protein
MLMGSHASDVREEKEEDEGLNSEMEGKRDGGRRRAHSIAREEKEREERERKSR